MYKKSIVSIIIPCYKLGKYLPDAIESVIAQSYCSWECIIIDDGSPDNTEEIANRYTNHDKRIKYIKQKNKGLSSARNIGIRNSVGEFILTLDADDILNPEYLTKTVKVLDSEPNIKLVYTRVKYFGDKQGEMILNEYTPKHILLSNMIISCALFRRSDYDLTPGYDELIRESYEDWDFWISLLLPDGNVHKINEILFYYRYRNDSMIHSIKAEKEVYITNYIFKKHINMYLRYYGCPIKYYKIINTKSFKILLVFIKYYHLIKSIMKTNIIYLLNNKN